jgi:hypothetical protein
MVLDLVALMASMMSQASGDEGNINPGPRPPVEFMADQAVVAPQDAGKILTKEKSWVTIYGFLRLDVDADTSRPDSIQIPQVILSKDDTNLANARAAGKHDYSMHPRMTRIGLDFDGPTVPELGGAKVTGKLETDWYNLTGNPNTTSSNSREFIRMRLAYGLVDWGSFSILFGQAWDVASPLNPTPNNDFVMWNAGNTGDRRPQIRPEFRWEDLTITGEVGVTGAEDAANNDPFGNNFQDGEAGWPTFQLRVGYGFMLPWVPKKQSSVGVWTHYAREQIDIGTLNGTDKFASKMDGFDFTLWLLDIVSIRGEGWMGRNLSDVRGGIGQGVEGGHEIRSHGGWVELGVQATPWWMPVVGITCDNPNHTYLAANGRDRNGAGYIANRLRFGPIEVGADWLHWVTEYKGPGIRDGIDNRFNVFFAYWF